MRWLVLSVLVLGSLLGHICGCMVPAGVGTYGSSASGREKMLWRSAGYFVLFLVFCSQFSVVRFWCVILVLQGAAAAHVGVDNPQCTWYMERFVIAWLFAGFLGCLMMGSWSYL